MLTDLLLPFPTSHPSTIPSDLIHPPLRNGIFLPYPHALLLVLLLVQLIEAALYSLYSVSSPFYYLLLSSFLPFDCLVNLAISIFRPCSAVFLFPFFKLVDFSFPQSCSRDANDATILITRYRHAMASALPSRLVLKV